MNGVYGFTLLELVCAYVIIYDRCVPIQSFIPFARLFYFQSSGLHEDDLPGTSSGKVPGGYTM